MASFIVKLQAKKLFRNEYESRSFFMFVRDGDPDAAIFWPFLSKQFLKVLPIFLGFLKLDSACNICMTM